MTLDRNSKNAILDLTAITVVALVVATAIMSFVLNSKVKDLTASTARLERTVARIESKIDDLAKINQCSLTLQQLQTEQK